MTNTSEKPKREVSGIAKIIASFFYSGFFPIAPGTVGSLAAFAIYFPLLLYGNWQIYLAVVIFVSLIGVWAAGRAEIDSGIVDPSFVVIDEVAGQLATLFLIPFSWPAAVLGFLLFRMMDIVKPFPAGRAEHLPGGWGIMTDDLIAGVYANLILRGILFGWHYIHP